MQTGERLPLPQIILLLAGMAILLIMLLHAATLSPVGITRNNALRIQQVARLGEGRVYTAAWSPDSRTIALGGSIGIWIRDAINLNVPPRLLEDHTGFVFDVTFNPTGTLLASGDADGVRLWYTQTWQSAGVLEGHSDYVTNVLFSPDGRWLASADSHATAASLRLWDTSNWQPVAVIETERRMMNMAFSADSRYLAFTTEQNVHLLDIAAGEWEPLLERTNPLSSRLRAAFDDSGRLVLGDSIRLQGTWTIEEGRVQFAPTTHEQLEGGLRAFFGLRADTPLSPERINVTRETAREWAAIERRSTYMHAEAEDLLPSPDGQSLIWERYDQWELWQVVTQQHLGDLHDDWDWLYRVSVLPGNTGIAATSYYQTHLWHFEDGLHTALDLRQSGGSIQQMLVRNDIPIGLFTGWTGRLQLLDLTSGVAQHSLDAITAPNSVHDRYRVSRDERYMALNRHDGSTIIWDLQAGAVVSQLARTAPDVRYRPLAFSPDATLLAADIQDQDCRCRVVSLWDVASGEPVAVIGDTGRTGWTAVFSPDGSRLVAAGGDTDRNNFIRIWNIETGEETGTFYGPRYNIYHLAITPDGRYVAGRTLTEVWLWDIQAEPGQAALLALSDETRDYQSAVFNPRGDLLAVGTTRGEILLFEVPTGEQIARLRQHKGTVQDLAFTADGRMIVSAGADGTVRLWRTDRVSPIRGPALEPVALPTVAITPTAAPAG